jgi:hypothetical protein
VDVTKNERGFQVGRWTDKSGSPCELQQSSAIDGNASEEEFAERVARPGTSFVWLGKEGIGNRMHLDRSQVTELVNRLNAWLKTGSFLFTREQHGG